MDPNILQLALFAEQMAALLAKTIIDLRAVIQNAHTQSVDQILEDADAAYQKIIDDAKNPPGSKPSTNSKSEL